MKAEDLKVLGISVSNRRSLGSQKPRYEVELQGVFKSLVGTQSSSSLSEILTLSQVSGHLLQAILADLEFLDFEVQAFTSSPISSQELPSGDPIQVESPSTVSEGSDE